MRQRRRPLTISSADTQAVITTVERHLPHSLCNDDIRNQQPLCGLLQVEAVGHIHCCSGAGKLVFGVPAQLAAQSESHVQHKKKYETATLLSLLRGKLLQPNHYRYGLT